jgi:RecA-family ATPase
MSEPMSEETVIKDMNDGLVAGFDILQSTDRAWARGDRKSAPSWRSHAFTAKELQFRTYAPIRYIIPGLIPEGLSLLVGRPKIGKSWMALDIALSVASGTTCLGVRTPEQGDVLYCALEDNERRLKSRISKLLASSKWPERLTLATQWKRLNEGGVHDLKEWMKDAKQPRLILLDTLANVRPVSTQEGYAQDYAALTQIHRLANDRGIGIMALHHQRPAASHSHAKCQRLIPPNPAGVWS